MKTKRTSRYSIAPCFATRKLPNVKHLHNLQSFFHVYFFKSSNQLSKIAVRLMISDMFILYHMFYFCKQRYFLYLLNSMSQLWLNFSWCLLDTVSLAWNCCYERKLDVMTFLDVNVIVNEIIRQELENLLLDWWRNVHCDQRLWAITRWSEVRNSNPQK